MHASPLSNGWPSAPVPESTVEAQVAACHLTSAPVGPSGGDFADPEVYHDKPKKHPQIQLTLNSILDPQPLQAPLVYRAQDLADKTKEGFLLLHESRIITNKQLHAKERVRHLHANAEPRYRNISEKDVSAWPTVPDLEEYMKAFDDFFFFGALKIWVRIELQHNDIPCDGGICVGTTQFDLNPPQVLIKMSNRHAIWKDPNHRYNSILGTLLHEMVHALFLFYGCKCRSCTTDDAKRRTVGFTGHGPSWKSLAVEVQATVGRQFLDLVSLVESDCMVIQASVDRELREVRLRNEAKATEPYLKNLKEHEPIARRTRGARRRQRMEDDIARNLEDFAMDDRMEE